MVKTQFSLVAFVLALGLAGCNFGDGKLVPAGTIEKGASKDVTLFTVTSNNKPGKVYSVILRVDSDTLTAQNLVYRGATEGDAIYDLNGLKSGDGLVLLVEQGYKVVRLKSDNFDKNGGGAVRMIYLKNAIWGSEGTFNIDIVREGQNWLVYSNNSDGRKKFTKMDIQAGSFGVSSVTTSL